jgi:hypothetical protein
MKPTSTEIDASVAVYERGRGTWGAVITTTPGGALSRGTGSTAEAAYADAQERAKVVGAHEIPKLLRAELEDTGAILFHETFVIEAAPARPLPKKTGAKKRARRKGT